MNSCVTPLQSAGQSKFKQELGRGTKYIYNKVVSITLTVREQQKRDRQARIYNEALRLFKERGFQKTTVLAIAKAARVSRGTVFNYYPYKEALLLEYVAFCLKGLEQAAQDQLASGAAPTEVLYVVFDELAGFVENNKHLVLPLSYELLNPDPERSKAAFKALPLARLVQTLLTHGADLGLVRTDFSRERLARTVANSYFLTALQWAAYRSDRSIKEELRKTLKLTLEGILTVN